MPNKHSDEQAKLNEILKTTRMRLNSTAGAGLTTKQLKSLCGSISQYQKKPLAVRLELRVQRLYGLIDCIPKNLTEQEPLVKVLNQFRKAEKIIYINPEKANCSEAFKQFFKNHTDIPMSSDTKEIATLLKLLETSKKLDEPFFNKPAWILYATAVFFQEKIPLNSYVTLVDFYNLNQKLTGKKVALSVMSQNGKINENLAKNYLLPLTDKTLSQTKKALTPSINENLAQHSLRAFEKNIVFYPIDNKTFFSIIIQICMINYSRPVVELISDLNLFEPHFNHMKSITTDKKLTSLVDSLYRVQKKLPRKLTDTNSLIVLSGITELSKTLNNIMEQLLILRKITPHQFNHSDNPFLFLEYQCASIIPALYNRIRFLSNGKKAYYLLTPATLFETLERVAHKKYYIPPLHRAGRVSLRELENANDTNKAIITHPVLGVRQAPKSHGFYILPKGFFSVTLHDYYHRQVREFIPPYLRDICLHIKNEMKNLLPQTTRKSPTSREIARLSEQEYIKAYRQQDITAGKFLATVFGRSLFQIFTTKMTLAGLIASVILIKNYPEYWQELKDSDYFMSKLGSIKFANQVEILTQSLNNSTPLLSIITALFIKMFFRLEGSFIVQNSNVLDRYFKVYKSKTNQLGLFFKPSCGDIKDFLKIRSITFEQAIEAQVKKRSHQVRKSQYATEQQPYGLFSDCLETPGNSSIEKQQFEELSLLISKAKNYSRQKNQANFTKK